MKKILAWVLVLTMVFSLAACANTTTTEDAQADADTSTDAAETTEDAGTSTDTAEDATEDATPTTDLKVAMICDSSISDGGWGMSCYNAMVDAAAEHGWTTEVSDSID